MMESTDRIVHLRIRFAGLCLFVPDPAQQRVHVLMPKSDAQAHHADGTHMIPDHRICIHWVSNGNGCSKSLKGKKKLALRRLGTNDLDFALRGVFPLESIKPVSGCPDGGEGKADPASAPTDATMELFEGVSKIINRGARWKISKRGGSKHPIPTVLDWWVRNVSQSALKAMLREWNVFGDDLPDVGAKNTVDLWIIHAPEDDQDPGKITGKPEHAVGPPHFGLYYTLVTCGKYDVQPHEPELEDETADPDRPHWPGPKSFSGMLVNCMLAKADIA